MGMEDAARQRTLENLQRKQLNKIGEDFTVTNKTVSEIIRGIISGKEKDGAKQED